MKQFGRMNKKLLMSAILLVGLIASVIITVRMVNSPKLVEHSCIEPMYQGRGPIKIVSAKFSLGGRDVNLKFDFDPETFDPSSTVVSVQFFESVPDQSGGRTPTPARFIAKGDWTRWDIPMLSTRTWRYKIASVGTFRQMTVAIYCKSVLSDSKCFLLR